MCLSYLPAANIFFTYDFELLHHAGAQAFALMRSRRLMLHHVFHILCKGDMISRYIQLSVTTLYWPSVAPASVLHSSAISTTCSRLKSSCGAAVMATAATRSNIPKQIKRDMILFLLLLLPNIHQRRTISTWMQAIQAPLAFYRPARFSGGFPLWLWLTWQIALSLSISCSN